MSAHDMGQDLVERVARIIAPESWRTYDRFIDPASQPKMQHFVMIYREGLTTPEQWVKWWAEDAAPPYVDYHISEWRQSVIKATAIAALTPPAAEGDVTQAAFTEGLWAGWRSGLAGEQMDDVYAAKSWSASDASAHLAHAAPKVAGVPTCPTCTLTDVSLERTCHNSSCAEYALPVTVYEGWPVPKPFSAAPSAPGSGEG